jgi:hypothetical protein
MIPPKRLSFIVVVCSLAFVIFSCSDSSVGPNNDSDDSNGDSNGDDVEEFDSQAANGASAEAYLTDDQFTTLEIEIDYMEGYEPTQEGIDRLVSFLENRLNKSDISIATTEITAQDAGPYSTSDIKSIENEERDNYTEADGSTLHAYFLIVDGEHDQSNVLGIAYWNTSMAFFGKTIDDISGSSPTNPSRAQVEGTVFRHEVGHNIGLVGNGSPHPDGQESHETDGSAHCTTDGCLMEPSVQTTDFFANLSGDVPDLDELCVEDLQANGGK